MNEKIDLSKYEGHTEGPWDVYGPHPLFRSGAYDDEGVGEHLPFTRVDMKLIADAPRILGTALRATKRLEAVESMLRKSGFWVSQEGWDESDKGDEMLVSLDYLIQYYQDLKDSSEGSEGDHMHTRSIGDTDFGQGNGELESNYGDGQPEWYSGPNM